VIAPLARVSYLLFAAAVVSTGLGAQAPSDITTAVYAVSYVEVPPSSRAAITALKEYQNTSRKDDGCLRLELFGQIDRPGHFVIVEAWTDQRAFDAHGALAHTKQFLDTLRPFRLSDYDQRPYKPLLVGPTSAGVNGQAVFVVTHVDTLPAPQSDAPGLLKRLAEDSRKEEGNLRFDVLQHTTRANHFTIVEAWQSRKALDAHAAAAHTRQYRDALQPMSGSPFDERVYRPIE
jgi:quinol monooxygenase YgiN